MTKQQKTKVDELREVLKNKGQADAKARTEAQPNSANENQCDELTDQIRAAEEEAKDHYDKLLRVMAEFENFKKRMAREREDQFKYANETLLKDLLPPLDDLDRVLDHIPPDASPEIKAIAEGVDLVKKSLATVLEKSGLKEVPAEGETFDPTHHEAIATIESDAHEPGKVMAVHRKGYTLYDRLLRPAMVTVAKTKEEPGEK